MRLATSIYWLSTLLALALISTKSSVALAVQPFRGGSTTAATRSKSISTTQGVTSIASSAAAAIPMSSSSSSSSSVEVCR
jgi:uncharacterized lipoprotein